MSSQQSEEAIKKSERIQTLYNELVDHVHDENNFYKKEYENIRSEVANLLQENNELSKRLMNNEDQQTDEAFRLRFVGNQEKLDDDTLLNMKQQLTCIENEKKCAELLWRESQNTIKVLEHEVDQYRKRLRSSGNEHEVIQRCKTALNTLQEKCAKTTEELEQQLAINSELEENNKALRLELEEYKKEVEGLIQQNTDLLFAKQALEKCSETYTSKITSLKNNIKETTETLGKTCNLAEFYKTRENSLAAELQEIKDTSEKLIREKSLILEENDHLAKIIGEVLHEASQKVEHELQGLKDKYEKQLAVLEKRIKETNNAVRIENNRSQESIERAQNLEEKLKAVIKHNSCLQTLYNSHLKAMEQQHKKLEILQFAFAKERESNKLYMQRELEVDALLENNRSLQIRWKELIQDVTCKLETRIEELNRENKNLKQQIMSLLQREQIPVGSVMFPTHNS